MDRDLVLVIPQYRLGLLGEGRPQYRLGLLGFLPEAPSMPGNYGMLDQVAALRWVQDNIAAFGGDPKQVTLGGDCAGGASALYHMISPSSTGLFQRVLSLSGTPLSPWARHPSQRHTMLIISKHIKCPSHDLTLNEDCLRKKPLEELLLMQMYVLEAMDLYVGNAKLSPALLEPSDDHDPKEQLL